MGAYSFKEITVDKKAFALAMEIFKMSKLFTNEEKNSMTNQVIISSRSACANLAEAYRKKRYPAKFISKLTDCYAEKSENAVCSDTAYSCEYITAKVYTNLITKNKTENYSIIC